VPAAVGELPVTTREKYDKLEAMVQRKFNLHGHIRHGMLSVILMMTTIHARAWLVHQLCATTLTASNTSSSYANMIYVCLHWMLHCICSANMTNKVRNEGTARL
jgi:hypothetical protein